MRILLIQPAKQSISLGGEEVFLYEPLALEYIAAGVSKDHDVMIFDQRLEKNLPDAIEKFNPQIIGITSYSVHVNPVKKLFEQIKILKPGILTVVGGHHATIIPEDFLSPSIDLIVMGEGVFTFKEIVTRFEKGEGFDDINGIAFEKNGKLVKTEFAKVVDLDAVPFPDRSLTAKYRKRYYSEWMKPLASIRTSKGCPFRCNFCALWKLTEGRYLKRSPAKVVEELTGIEEEYVFFADDESLVDAKRMKTLAQLIKDAGIKKRYFLYGRTDTIAKNPDLLKMWRDIGLEKVFVGLEFFRDQDLDHIGKGTSISDNKEAIRTLSNLGIEPYPSFIIRPEWRHEDFQELRHYCRNLGLSFAGFAVLTPLPGTDLYEQTKDQLITNNYDYFDFIHTVLPTSLPLKDFYNEYYQLYMKAFSTFQSLSRLKKYPLKQIPNTLVKAFGFYNRLRKAYLDYDHRPAL
ncbi:MAG TPA: radical SAM protein [Dehalococcoidia bacterium]|nr:radical SAM protein [Dehalococcoidia bacterium]